MYESRRKPPLTNALFARRVVWHFLAAQGLVMVSLAGGMAGYHQYERLPWADAFLNTAMLLGGMGPVDPPLTLCREDLRGVFRTLCGAGVFDCRGGARRASATSPAAQVPLERGHEVGSTARRYETKLALILR